MSLFLLMFALSGFSLGQTLVRCTARLWFSVLNRLLLSYIPRIVFGCLAPQRNRMGLCESRTAIFRTRKHKLVKKTSSLEQVYGNTQQETTDKLTKSPRSNAAFNQKLVRDTAATEEGIKLFDVYSFVNDGNIIDLRPCWSTLGGFAPFWSTLPYFNLIVHN